MEQRPFGLGYGNFPAYLRTNVSNPHIQTAFFHAHWLPVQVGLDAGWLGLAGFALLAFSPLIVGLRRALLNKIDKGSLGFAAALAGLLAQGWYEYLLAEISFLIILCVMVWGAWPRETSSEVESSTDQERSVDTAGLGQPTT